MSKKQKPRSRTPKTVPTAASPATPAAPAASAGPAVPAVPETPAVAASRTARLAAWWRSATQANRIAIAVPLATTAIAGVISVVVALVPTLTSDDDILGLVDVAVHDLQPGTNTANVDVKVRSKGAEVGYIKGVEIEVLDSRRIDGCTAPLPVPASATYDVALPAEPEDLPYTRRFALDHEVAPGKVDRFVLRLGTEGAGLNIVGATVYRFRLIIPYNEGSDSRLESEPLLAFVKYPYENSLGPPEGATECVKRNARDLADMAATDGVRSAAFDTFVTNYVTAAAKTATQ
ncbi:hypothetical protein [Actinoplanes xinjiangensis]|uniref:hypothetical protein n=1 Tax=Actinoplanes xinjiangensis TaxID=512350 RepID=UPI003443FB56